MIDLESTDKAKAQLIYEFRKDIKLMPFVKRREYVKIIKKVMSTSDAFAIEVYTELINYIK